MNVAEKGAASKRSNLQDIAHRIEEKFRFRQVYVLIGTQCIIILLYYLLLGQ